jgi:hypothetical protein
MKKILFFFSLFGVILFANPSTPYVYGVYNDDYQVYDYLYYGQYQNVLMNETSPYEPTGYISQMQVMYNHTYYQHPAGRVYFDVHYPITTPSTSAVFIWERNWYEEANGVNDRLIKGYTASPYQEAEIVLADGSKLVRYSLPDLSPYHKRITIATCPNMKTQTTAVCTYTVTDILGVNNYPN